MTSSTSERQIREREARFAREREIDKDITEVLMSHVSGRNWVWRWLEFCQLTNGNANLDPHYMAFEKGQRNVGLRLLKDLQSFCPREYAVMVQENTSVRMTPDPSNEEGQSDE